MANTQFTIKQHDLLPSLVVTLLDDDTAVDLTTAISARFLMRSLATGLKVSALMSVLDQTDADNLGKVSYDWQALDTDTVGTYNAEVEIIWPGDRPQTFPAAKTLKYFKVVIQNDLTD